MKMQIAFRRLIGQKFAGYDVAAAVGLLDLPHGHDRFDECIANFHLPMQTDGREPEKAICFWNPRPLDTVADSDTLLEMRRSDLEDIVKARFRRTTPSDSSNAHFFFRKTSVASQYPRGTVYAFSGTLCVDNVLDLDCRDVLQFGREPNALSASVLAFEGRVGRTIREEFGETDLVAVTQGHGLSQLLQEPVWGFGEEPIALGSTLDLEKQRLYQLYTDLFFGEKDDEVAKRRYLQIRILAEQAGFTLLDEDPVLARALWRVRQDDDYVPPFSPKTRSQLHAANQALNEAFAAIERGEDDAYFDEWRRDRDEGNDIEASMRLR
jgi:hypothetical protein